MSAVARPAEILGIGMVTPVGLDARSAAAAVRAGVTRVAESSVYNKASTPQRLSLVPEDALPPLVPPLDASGITSAHARMLRLAAPALAEALDPLGPGTRPPPVLLALPEVRPGHPDPVGRAFLAQLAVQAGGAVDASASKLYRQGAAGGLVAVHDALAVLAASRAEVVLVAAVDTFLDLRRLAALDAEDRLLGGRVMDGFIPGEGAAALLLAAPGTAKRLGARAPARVLGASTGSERGHRYSAQPYLGEGLATAVQELFAAVPAAPPVACVYCGFNGENLPAKEWGVSYLRSAGRFAGELEIEHPADCVGDMGAALGLTMAGLAAIGIQKGYRGSPALVWSTSDREPRAVMLLSGSA